MEQPKFKTTLPTDPIKDFVKWRQYIADQVMTPEDKFEAEFMRIWLNFKRSVNSARTKK
tara:strand:- start:3303 stop:3479 length:177 start_codon:yes stop_codon:yes gene_type:complete